MPTLQDSLPPEAYPLVRGVAVAHLQSEIRASKIQEQAALKMLTQEEMNKGYFTFCWAS